MKRRRDIGPRRRCATDRTLVRSRPAVNIPPPPIPTAGYIKRFMEAASIADYEGIATASWSSGATGTITTGQPSWNCLYYHTSVANAQTDSVDVILNPIRWTIHCPASDGGTFDFWDNSSALRFVQDDDASCNVGLTTTLLPSGHFAEYLNGYGELYDIVPPSPCRPTATGAQQWRESTLQAIASTTALSNVATIGVAAIRHRINGTAVGTLQTNPPGNRSTTDAWRFDLVLGDSYSCDIWYRVRIPAQGAGTAAQAQKACWYIPTTRVSNGSRRFLTSLDNRPIATFRNINFTPNLNWNEQTYNITIAGHTGWTLKDGSDGPHKMITGGDWFGAGDTWKNISGTGYLNGVVVRLNEIPQIELWPGPQSSLWPGGGRTANQPYIYRPVNGLGYRNNVASTDFSTVTLAPQGGYDQAGTTTFYLVNSSITRTTLLRRAEFTAGGFPDGNGSGPAPAPAADIPTEVTISRASR